VSQGSLPAVQGEVTKRPEEMAAVNAPVTIRDRDGAAQQVQIPQSSCSSAIICNETPDIEGVPDKPVFERTDLVPFPATVTRPTDSSVPAGTAHEVAPAATKPPLEHLPVFEQPENPVPVIVPQTAHSKGQSAKKISRPSGTAPRTESGRPTIYLTFDDGPSRLTLPIASYLNSQGITATFFVLGNNVIGHEKAIRDTVALGHHVGNHTQTHDLKKLNSSLQQGINEIARTSALIEKLGGDGRMVRIPYGASSKALISAVTSERGQIFDWDINSLDSSKRGAKDHTFIEREVTQQLQKSNKRNIILLFHDGAGHEATLVAIRNLIPKLKQEGYRFGLLSRTERVAQSKSERNPSP
jgi:peptidoglycan/xylan/chitin deacetylase (PgdA/CDA1 family)